MMTTILKYVFSGALHQRFRDTLSQVSNSRLALSQANKITLLFSALERSFSNILRNVRLHLKAYRIVFKVLLEMIISKTEEQLPMVIAIGLVVSIIYSFLAWFYRRKRMYYPALAESFVELPVVAPVAESLAAQKLAAENTAERFLRLEGYEPHVVQLSSRDIEKRRTGVLAHITPIDLHHTIRFDELRDNSAIWMFDVDGYLDMRVILSQTVRNYVIFTFVPENLAVSTAEYAYRVLKNNVVETRVGDKVWKHQVWDYEHDAICVYSWTWWGKRRVTYRVSRKTIGNERMLMLLEPMMVDYVGISQIIPSIVNSTWTEVLADMPYECKPLERLVFTQGDGFNRLLTTVKGEQSVHIGSYGTRTPAKVSVSVDDTIRIMAKHSELYMGQVSGYVGGNNIVAAPVYDYYKSKAQRITAKIIPRGERIIRYRMLPQVPDEPVKETMVDFMAPILRDGWAPDDCKANEFVGLQERLLNVQPPELKMTSYLHGIISEFVEFTVDEPHVNHPVDEFEVYNRQDAPRQRRILDKAQWAFYKLKTAMMWKKEMYGGDKPRRIISTIDPTIKMDYSRVMYGFENVMKKQKWYAFSRTPREIALRMTHILKEAKTATNSDFSKFDGHVSSVLREVERLTLLRAYHPSWHKAVKTLHGWQYGIIGITPSGIRYETLYSRLSGSPETSCFNSLCNAFVAYLALRLMGFTPIVAYGKLGIYGGDDGLTPDLDEKCYIRAAEMVGQVVTIDTIVRGSRGVKFLARVYSPDVWYGDTNSMCDIRRQLGKFHTTVKLDVTPEVKLVTKARSFLLTDEHTPVIGIFCRRVASLSGGLTTCRMLERWIDKYDKKDQYFNRPAEWMFNELVLAVPGFDLYTFINHVDDCKTLQDLMELPHLAPIAPIVVKQPTIVNGVTYPVVPQYTFHDIKRYHDVKFEPNVGVAVVTAPKPEEKKGVQQRVLVQNDTKEQKRPCEGEEDDDESCDECDFDTPNVSEWWEDVGFQSVPKGMQWKPK